MKPPMRNDRSPGSAIEDEFRLDEFLPFQLAVTADRVSRLFARHLGERFGLSASEWRVLSVVGRSEQISPSMVSSLTHMDKVKVSRAAATLVARGMLRQTQDPADGRGRILRLTRRGAGTYRAMIPVAREVEATLAGGLGRAELATLQRALARLSAQVEANEGDEDRTAED
jgi:DNA-binding MarR family transcriptional regulator